MIAHLEGEYCPEIAKDEYKMLRVQKRAYKKAFERTLGATAAAGQAALAAPDGTARSVASDCDGGVGVDLLDDEDRDPTRGLEEAGGGHCIDCEDMDAENVKAASYGQEKGKDKENMPPNANNNAPEEEEEEEDLMDFTDIQSLAPATNSNANANANANRNSSGNSSVKSYATDWAKWIKYRDQPSDSPITRDTGVVWDADRFYNQLLGVYVCECDETFTTAKGLETHIHSGVHAGGVVR